MPRIPAEEERTPAVAVPPRVAAPAPAAREQVLALQASAGNQAVTRLLAGRALQRDAQPSADPRKAERVRTGQGNQITTWLSAIQKLKALRIDAWEKTAHSPEPKPGLAILEAMIAIVSLGLGGVVYGVIEGQLKERIPDLLFEFVALSGLEAGDLAAEA